MSALAAPPGRVDTEALKARWPVEVLAERYGVPLRGRGRRLYGRCPFHDDRSPSLVVYPETRSWFCFGCRQWGDAIDWVARMEGIDFLESCRLLGADTGSPPPARARPTAPRSPFADGLPGWALRTLRAAADVYREALPRSSEALAYLRARGIGGQAIGWAWLGYASGSDLVPGLRRREIPPEAARDLGLLNHRGREVLRGRLVVPVIAGGEVVTLTGRAVVHGLERRYLDLPLPPHLLGGDLVRQSRSRRVVLTEGVVDYLVALGWGLSAISPMGTHAAEQVRQEACAACEGSEVVLLALDNDEGGSEAADAWREWLGPKAAPITWPPDLGDVGDLGPNPDGRTRFLRLLADAEARWRQQWHESLRRAS